MEPTEKPYRCTIQIQNEDLDRVWTIYEKMISNSRLGKPTSKRMIKTFIELIDIDPDYTEKCVRVHNICRKINSRFVNTKVEKAYPPDHFKNMMKKVVEEIVFSKSVPTDKDLFIEYVYNIITERTPRWKRSKEELGDYMLYVLAGFITMQFGFTLTTKKNPTNQELFQSVRNAVSKISPEAK